MSSQEMYYEFEQNILMDDRLRPYEILNGFESPGVYGHKKFSEFYDAFSMGIAHKIGEVLCIAGEPVSGKSSSASNIVALLHEEGVTVDYLSWSDCLRAAKCEGIIPPEKSFFDINPNEFHEASLFLGDTIDKLVTNHTQDRYTTYATVVDVVAMTVADTPHDIDRGTSAVAHAVAQHEASVLLTAGDPEMRNKGKNLRSEIHTVSTIEGLYDLLNKFSITRPRSKKEAMKLWEELKSGAPPEVIERNERELDTVIFDAHISGQLPLLIPIDSPDALQQDPELRELIITNGYMPLLARDIFKADEDKVFIGRNPEINKNPKKRASKIKRPSLLDINYFRNNYPIATL